MGRLFWKFFFVFWLAQVVTAAGVGVAIWLHHPDQGQMLRRAALEGLRPGFGPGPDHGPGLGDDRWTRGPRAPQPGLPIPLMPIVAGSAVSLIFAALLAWYVAKPIRNLRGAFEAVASGDLQTRVGSAMGGRRDELAELGRDFDRMAQRLRSLLDGRRRLLHDVSHELRSPLARLQAAADLLRQQPDRSAELAERIERDTSRMDRLVAELLTLARLDAGITQAAGVRQLRS